MRNICLVLVAVVLVLSTLTTGQVLLSLDEVIPRATAYVETFIAELSTVVMEEDYEQSAFAGRRGEAIKMNLRSEFLLVPLRGTGTWTGFRDVFEVNGRRVRDREDRLAALFIDNPTTALSQAKEIAEESSRYNVGLTYRTFNIPTYALLSLHPSYVQRFRFEKSSEGCAGFDTAWEVRFEEVGVPTMTRGFNGINLPATGHVCLDPESGRVFETEMDLHHPAVNATRRATDAKATVKFAVESSVDMLVPVEMRERYLERGGASTTSIARYRNYRRFGVTTNEDFVEPPK